MPGTLYGVGVGPGDPELITLKAVRLIRESTCIAAPGKDAREAVAYKIAVQAVPELREKKLLSVYMPMSHDRATREACHREGVRMLEEILDTGENVVFLTLGDPTVYSTFSYLQARIEVDGYPTALVSGITSFCAAAARLNRPLSLLQESLHIIPAQYRLDEKLDRDGTYILMKSGKKMDQVKRILRESKKDVCMVENCGMEKEKIYLGVDEIPDDAGYYSLIIAKEPERAHD
ncbi:MAG: precorrin-2 C(20)-methyltransferase [Clostridiales bacterium]|nr:precorrin-2 C(20)-methyltransferase [Clostridiales bacterium]MCD8132310.1 precorrin-2 C(20)-methyltransferase [Clostridiales bacterium]